MAMSRHWWDPGQFSQMIHASHSQGFLEIAQSESSKVRVWSSFLQPCVLMYCIWGPVVLLGVSRLEASTIRGPTGGLSLCTFPLSMRPDSVKRLYQVLVTLREAMVFLQWGYFGLNFYLTITADFDSCIHNVLWALISSVPVITEVICAFSGAMMTMATLFLWQC